MTATGVLSEKAEGPSTAKIRGFATVRLGLAPRAAHLCTPRLPACAFSRRAEPLSPSCDAFSMPCLFCATPFLSAVRLASPESGRADMRVAHMRGHGLRFCSGRPFDKMGPKLEAACAWAVHVTDKSVEPSPLEVQSRALGRPRRARDPSLP